MRVIPSVLVRLRAGLAKLCRSAGAVVAWLGDQIPEAFLLGGAAAVTYGVSRLSVPAGWIVGGLLALLAGWRLGRPTNPSEVPRG